MPEKLSQLSDVEQFQPGLSDDLKQDWLDTYGRAFTAREMAGGTDPHDVAVQIASAQIGDATRSDEAEVPVLVLDTIPVLTEDATEVKFERKWPSPGKGAPRNKYGGFDPQWYGDPAALESGKVVWLDSWRVYLAGQNDAEAFDGIWEWLWAVSDAIKEFSMPGGLWETPAREGDLPDVTVFSKPGDYGLTAWDEPPDGETKLSVMMPKAKDVEDLWVIFHSERKRKEIDGLLRDDAMRTDHFDLTIIRFDEDSGVLIVDTPIAQLTVLPYTDAEGNTVHELLHPEDYATAGFLGTIPGRPITDGHPSEAVVLMSQEDAAVLTLGWTHTDPKHTRVDGDLIITREVVFDEQLIDDIRSGRKRQVSVGRRALVVDEQGTYNGMTYQRRQKEPVFDHLAHVPLGRCGPACAVPHIDRMDAVQVLDEGTQTGNEGGQTMPNDAKTYQLTDDVQMTFCPDATDEQVQAWTEAMDSMKADATEAVQLRADKGGLETKVTELQTKADQAEGTADGTADQVTALQTKVDALETQLTEAGNQTLERMDAAIDERLQLVRQAEWMISDEYDFTGKSAQAIRLDILTALDPEFKADDRSEDYIRARFDKAVELFESENGQSTVDASLKGDDGDGEDGKAEIKADARTGALHRTPTSDQE